MFGELTCLGRGQLATYVLNIILQALGAEFEPQEESTEPVEVGQHTNSPFQALSPWDSKEDGLLWLLVRVERLASGFVQRGTGPLGRSASSSSFRNVGMESMYPR